MGDSAATLNPYILYSILGFNALLMAVLLGAVLRLMFLMGRMDGRLSGLETAVADLRQDHANLRQEMTNLRQEMADLRQEMVAHITRLDARMDRLDARMDLLDAGLADLREQVGLVRGLLTALHQKVDLLMTHRHDDTSGAVLLTPTVAAPVSGPVPDPAAG